MFYKTVGLQQLKNITFILLITSLCQVAQAVELDKIQVRTIAISPYGIESQPEQSGIYFDLANLIVSEAGYEVEHYISPYARIVHELKVGLTDLTIMFRYKELEEHVTYIAALPTLKNVVIGIKGTSFPSIASLKGKRLAYLRGAKFNEQIDNDQQIDKYFVTDFDQGIKMLVLGRVDAIIGPLDPIVSSALSAGKTDLFGEPLVVSERTPWLQISKKSKYLLSADEFNNVFKELERRGELVRLRKKYNMLNYKPLLILQE